MAFGEPLQALVDGHAFSVARAARGVASPALRPWAPSVPSVSGPASGRQGSLEADPGRAAVTYTSRGNWTANTTYAVADYVRVGGTGRYLLCTTAGTSAATAPTVPGSSNQTVTDGTVVWTSGSSSNPPSNLTYIPPTAGTPAVYRDTGVTQQLNAYFYCGLRKFELPLAPAGTVFRQRVWEEMVKIPYGQTRNYGEMARRLDSAARAIGGACGENPIPIIIPCHRVVASGPHIGGYSGRGGCDTKRALLELEGASHRP